MYIRYKRKQKKQGKIKKAIGTRTLSLTDKLLVAKYQISNMISNLVAFYSQSMQKAGNLTQTNLDVARYHFSNNNIQDAHLRYYIVTKLDKTSPEGYIGLGYINFIKKHYRKALKNFLLAKKYTKNAEKREKLSTIIQEIKLSIIIS